VTGVDISEVAIDFAHQLSADAGIPADFVRADVFDWFKTAAEIGEEFQIVFSSYGTLVWLSDINKWANGVSSVLEDGGKLVLIDFHPFLMIFEWDWTLSYPYFSSGEPLHFEDGIGDYVALSGESLAPSGFMEGITEFKNPFPVKEFQWSISDILSAILSAGLQLEAYREYPYMNGARLFKSMQQFDHDKMYPPAGFPNLPLMYGLVARKAKP
jgi:SAM-dependent methyltransferase